MSDMRYLADPSSATTQAASSTSTNSNTSGGNTPDGSSFFTPSGSPPLILAFLAIGLFTAAMIAVFGYRRIHWGRPWAADVQESVRPSRRRDDIGEKPKLWDLRATRGVTEVEGGWGDIMPFSASTVTIADAAAPRRKDDTRRPFYRRDTMFQRFPGIFRIFPRRTEPNYTTTTTTAVPTGTAIPPPPPPPPEALLRVAIPIAMPTPRGTAATGPSTSDEGALSKKGRLEYSIGLLEVPWRMEEG